MKIVMLKTGETVIVDDSDFESLSKVKWYIGTHGYAVCHLSVKEGGPSVRLMHRVLLGLNKGDKRLVDHINQNKLDNRRANLRICTQSENLRNRGKPSNNTSGFKGVSFCKQTGKWRAGIQDADGRIRNLGRFRTPEEAHAAYVKAAMLFHGEFASV